MNTDDATKAEMAIQGLLALEPPRPDADPIAWIKQATLFAEQLYKLQELQFNMLRELASVLLSESCPYSTLIATNSLCLLAFKSSGKMLLKREGVEPLNLLEEQKKKARDMLSDGTEIPEPIRSALLGLLGTEESEDSEYFPEGGIEIPFDGGKVH